jgi:transcriptional repressor of cell division inhibition gene dicB
MKTQEAIDFFGSKSELAKACGINPAAVSQWGEFVPTTQSYKLEIKTKGKLKAFRGDGNNEAVS